MKGVPEGKFEFDTIPPIKTVRGYFGLDNPPHPYEGDVETYIVKTCVVFTPLFEDEETPTVD